MPWGQRKSDRVQFQHEHSVNLMAVDGTWRRPCVLRDVSATGARLEVDGSTEVLTSREFFLVLSSTGLAFRRCQLVWINGPLVGVHFVFDKSKKAKATS
jgi:PilZ domain